MVLTSTLLYLTTCCRSDSNVLRTIDPDLAAYIIEFKAEMEQRGALPSWAPLPMVITYGATPPGTIGVCYLPANVIIIDKDLRDSEDEYKRKSTVMHELGHCMALINSHSDDPSSIMYFEHVPSDFSNWRHQMDELARFIKERSPIYRLKVQLETPDVQSR
jgi:hypothetical protein